MSSFRFIHCSDLHIDSPFQGFSDIDPEFQKILRQSTVKAFQNIVRLALDEKVDAVLIAGDIYDSADKSLQAQFKFRGGLQKLSDAGIPSFIVHGNHDPLGHWTASIEWPERVTVFPGDQVQCVPVMRAGNTVAHIHGISFPRRDVRENLALQFKKEDGEGLSVGILHCNVGGNKRHDNYAPCSIDDLVSAKMDYWALGHIHGHDVLRESHPAIVYSGNTQARHMKEAGPKVCCLVTLRPDAKPEIQRIPIDAVRFIDASLGLSGAAHIDAVKDTIQRQCERFAIEAEGRHVMIRLTLAGRTSVHGELSRPLSLSAVQEEVQTFFADRRLCVGVDLVLDTQGTYDIEELRQGSDFIADILTLYDEAEADAYREEIRNTLKPLFETWQGSRHLDSISGETLREWILKARNLTLDHLVESE